MLGLLGRSYSTYFRTDLVDGSKSGIQGLEVPHTVDDINPALPIIRTIPNSHTLRLTVMQDFYHQFGFTNEAAANLLTACLVTLVPSATPETRHPKDTLSS